MRRSTTCSTASGTWRFPSSGTMLPRRMAPAARTRPRLRRCSPAARASRKPRAVLPRLPRAASRRLLAELAVAVRRGTSAGIAALAGRTAEIRGVEAIGAAGGPELARDAARSLGCVAAVTGPVDHLSDGERTISVSNGHELLGRVTGTGCMSTAITGCFLAVRPDDPLEAATEALVAFGVAGEEAAKKAKGQGSFNVALYDALYALEPNKIVGRAKSE